MLQNMEVYFATFSFINSQGCIKLELTMDYHFKFQQTDRVQPAAHVQVQHEDLLQFLKACKRVASLALGRLELIYVRHPTCEYLYSEIILLVIPQWKQWEDSMNNILEGELAGPVGIKMSPDRTFKAADLKKLESAIIASKGTNPFYLIDSLMPGFMQQLPDSLPTDNPEVTCPTSTFIRLFWQELLAMWHDRFLKVLMVDLTRRFKEKMLLVKGFHNLSQVEIPQHVVELLKKGEKFSPRMPQPDIVYQRQFKSFV